jgi:hypothetical protein
MKPQSYEVTRPPRNERVILVGHAQREREFIERSLEELALLADTAWRDRGRQAGAAPRHRSIPRRSSARASCRSSSSSPSSEMPRW